MIDEEYDNIYWPELREALDILLLNSTTSGSDIICETSTDDVPCQRISFEQKYSAVYKCVCKQYSERLYHDLIQHVGSILQRWKNHLQSNDRRHDQPYSPVNQNNTCRQEELDFLKEFHKVTMQYCQAINSIVPIFTYMNRYYLENKMQTNLKSELLKLYSEQLADAFIESILQILVVAQGNPFSISPSMTQSLLQSLHTINTTYCTINPDLFARHIPSGVRPVMAEEELEAQRAADRALQEQLRLQGFERSDQTKKRGIDSADQFDDSSM